MERIKLIETINPQTFFDSTQIDGIFSTFVRRFPNDESLSFLTQDFAQWLDFEFYFHRSGEKYLSPYYVFLREQQKIYDVSTWESDSKVLAMRMLINKFALSWNKIWDALTTNYKPLENYDMEQTETPDITKERNTKSNTKITNTNEIETSQQNVFGFNSSDAVPSTSQEGSNTTTTEGNEDDNNTWEEETETGTRGLTRHGNIGVTTSQQMLLSEVDLRTKTIFTDIVLKDVDSMLCLMVY